MYLDFCQYIWTANIILRRLSLSNWNFLESTRPEHYFEDIENG